MAVFMQADTQRVEDSIVITPNPRTTASVNQRRSQRVLLSVPLVVTGTRRNGSAFSERTKTLVVNAHGGLVMLREPVLVGQILTMTNIGTAEEIVCKVMDVNTGNSGAPEIGVEFAEPCPRFWRVSFPPTDWTPRSPEARRLTQGKAQAPVTAPPLVKK